MGSVLAHPASYKIQPIGLTLQPANPNSGARESLSRKLPCQKPSPKNSRLVRSSRRANIVRPVRVRRSDPRDEHFQDRPVSVNASEEGIYFTLRQKSYYKGMRVFVTFPFSWPTIR